jgi:hypothetical protein
MTGDSHTISPKERNFKKRQRGDVPSLLGMRGSDILLRHSPGGPADRLGKTTQAAYDRAYATESAAS